MEKTHSILQILLIDDAQHDLDAQERALQSCKLLNPVLKFKNGPDTLAFLRAPDAAGQRFLIFLDLLMKPQDGISLLSQIRAENLAPGSITVMLSGLTDVKLLHQGYQLGAQTFLVKPLKIQDVMQLLTTLQQSVRVETEPRGNWLIWQTPTPTR